MKRVILFCAALLLFCDSAQAALNYGGDYYLKNKGNAFAMVKESDPIWRFINEVEGYLESTSGMTSLILTPGTAPTATEGTIYYDSTSKGLLLRNDSTWVTIDTAGASSLGTAYTAGSTVSVITDAITFTVTDTSNNRVLDLVQNDTTNNPEAIRITNTGSGDTLAFVSTGGKDIDGSGSTWSVTSVGAGSFLGVTAGASGVTLSNSETITNATNNGITFDSDTGTTEDFTIGLGANTNIITFSSASGVTTIDLGTMTTLSGMNAITGDAADLTISITADEGGEDLLIQQAGAVDGSLDLRSAGTGTDAIKMLASAGGIDVDSTGGVIVITTTADGAGDDITINAAGTAQDSSLILTSDGTGGDAVSIITTHANGDIKVNSGDMIDIDAADDFLLDVAGAAGEDILITNTGGSVIVTATEVDDAAISLQASAGGIDVDAAAAKPINIAGGSIALVSKTTGASAISLTTNQGTAETIVVTNTAGTGTGALTLTATAGGIDVDAAAAKEINIAGGNVAIVNKTAGATAITLIENQGATDQMVFTNTQGTNDAAIDITASAGGVDVDAAKSVTLTSSEGSADSVVLTSTGGGIDILAATTDAGGEDIDITLSGATDSSIILTSSGTGIDAVKLYSNGGTGSGILILSNTGTAAAATTETDASLQLTSTAGGIALTSALNGVDAIRLEATTGANSAITIQNVAGTAASATTQEDAAIQLYSQVGGIGLSSGLSAVDAIRIETSAAGGLMTLQSIAGTGASASTQVDAAIQLYAQAGGIGLNSGLAAADAIRLETTNAAGLMTLQSVAGTGAAAATETDAAIQLVASAGGIGLNSGLNAVNAIRLEANGGINETINVHANQGTAVTAGAASVQLLSDVGGIGIQATGNTGNGAIAIKSTAGGIDMDAKELFTVDLATGTAATSKITLTNTTGTAADAIGLIATAGGVDINAKEMFDVTVAGGTAATADIILLNSVGTDNAAVAISSTLGGIDINAKEMVKVDVAAGTAATAVITLTNTPGTDAAAIALQAVAGGVDIDAALAKDAAISGGQVILTGADAAADAVSLVASDGAGGITLNAGTGLINFSDDSLANIGDIAVDDIVDEANGDITYMVKTVIKTIWLDDDAGTPDFKFDDDAANSTAQNVDIGAIIPAYAEVIGAQARCYEATGAQTFQVTVGTASAGSEILAQATIDAANEIAVTATGSGPIVAATASVRNVWVQGDPSANWADVGSVGKWAIIVTYIDYGAAYTQNTN